MRVRGLKQRRAIRLLVLGAMIMVAIVPPASASATGALSWRSPRLVDQAAPFSNPAVLNGVSCPSASLCVGVDDLGSIARTTDPEAPRPTWMLTAPLEQNVTFYSISCPSVHLCVAVNQAGGSGERARIAISTDPTGSASTWKVSDANFGSIQNVVCPTTSLCVIDALGGLHVSTNPGAVHPSWKEALPESVGSDDLLTQVSCARPRCASRSGTAAASTPRPIPLEAARPGIGRHRFPSSCSTTCRVRRRACVSPSMKTARSSVRVIQRQAARITSMRDSSG